MIDIQVDGTLGIFFHLYEVYLPILEMRLFMTYSISMLCYVDRRLESSILQCRSSRRVNVHGINKNATYSIGKLKEPVIYNCIVLY